MNQSKLRWKLLEKIDGIVVTPLKPSLGVRSLQGPHQGAKKSTITGFSLLMTSLWNSSSSWTVNDDSEGFVTERHLLETWKLILGTDFNMRLDNMITNSQELSVKVEI